MNIALVCAGSTFMFSAAAGSAAGRDPTSAAPARALISVRFIMLPLHFMIERKCALPWQPQ